jgi:hypothetical protein
MSQDLELATSAALAEDIGEAEKLPATDVSNSVIPAISCGTSAKRGCVPKTFSEVMKRWNRLSLRNDRAVPFRSGRPGLAVQVEGTA